MAAPMSKKNRTSIHINSENKDPDIGCHSIFVLPQKIQKQIYKILVTKSREKGIIIADNFNSYVTHLVTGCDSKEQALRFLGWKHDVLEHPVVVKTNWLSECIKAGHVLEVTEEHMCHEENLDKDEKHEEGEEEELFPKHECQRVTPLRHHNEKITRALEVLEKNADFQNTEESYSRALAFRKAACSLKCLTHPLKSLKKCKRLPHIGNHSFRIIKDVFENDFSAEVEQILRNDWYPSMELFTGVFGVGPAIADKWYKLGMRSIEDVKRTEDLPHRDHERIAMGLAYYDDLSEPVLRCEADALFTLVKEKVQEILPGCHVVLTGGFRRGKESGHDIDVLISHPEEGKENGLLAKLLRCLEDCGLLLYGRHEHSTYNDDVLKTDNSKGQYLKSTLDHFEKWMGIMKLHKDLRTKSPEDCQKWWTDSQNPKHGESSSCSDSLDKEKKSGLTRGPSIGSAIGEAGQPRTWIARRVDLIVAPAWQYYYALVGWTGSKQFNRSLRTYSKQDLNMVLTSHGLYDKTKKHMVPADSEQQVFDNLKLTYREPSQRNC